MSVKAFVAVCSKSERVKNKNIRSSIGSLFLEIKLEQLNNFSCLQLIDWTKENEFREEFKKQREYFLAVGDFEQNYRNAFQSIGVL